jgi:hypothetical protein
MILIFISERFRANWGALPLDSRPTYGTILDMNTLLFILLTTFTQAQAAPIPPAPGCGYGCSQQMQSILADYQAAGQIDTAHLPAIFSGECYHLTQEYYPDQTHYGFTLLEQKDGEFYMGGVFAFFYKENPYRSLTVDQARDLTPRRFDNHHHLSFGENFAYADMNPEDPSMPWRFWLKQKENNILLLGQWGKAHFLYCRFPQN